MICESGTFSHDGCLFLEQFTTFVSDVRLMTSCQLTFDFVFGHVDVMGISAWSCASLWLTFSDPRSHYDIEAETYIQASAYNNNSSGCVLTASC